MTLDVKPYDIVGQGQDGSWKGKISKATCMELVKMGGEKNKSDSLAYFTNQLTEKTEKA